MKPLFVILLSLFCAQILFNGILFTAAAHQAVRYGRERSFSAFHVLSVETATFFAVAYIKYHYPKVAETGLLTLVFVLLAAFSLTTFALPAAYALLYRRIRAIFRRFRNGHMDGKSR